jgi:molybdopterin molybdotransferase
MALTRFEDAKALVLEMAGSLSLGDERIALGDALGRVLAADVFAPFSVPGYAHAAMDGYAIVTPAPLSAETAFDVVGRTMAGDARFRPIVSGEAVQIATGAMLPEGADRVVPVESSGPCGDDRVLLQLSPEAATHIRGADDDYHSGQLALNAGCRIEFAAAGVLASFGLGDVLVRRRPRVTVLVTGSELVPAGSPRPSGRIHDSNGTVLRGLLRAEGIAATIIGPLADDAELLRNAVRNAAASSDLVISTGGASAGQADFMPRLMAELGEVLFWRVAMRPGMPVLFARLGNALAFGLPGNPVAVVAGFLALVRPALRRLQASPQPSPVFARLVQSQRKSHNRLEFRRAAFAVDEQGVARVDAHPALSSGVLRSVAETNALILLNAERSEWEAGDVVEVLLYAGD